MGRATFQEIESFVSEVRTYLPTIRQQILACSQEVGAQDSLEAAYCHVQALRDAASMMGLKALSRLASTLEVAMGRVREGRGALDTATRGKIFKTLDDIGLALAGFRVQADRVTRSRKSGFAGTEDEDQAELADIFRIEAEQYFLDLARLFAELKDRPQDRGVLREIQRRAHTLKGAAGTAGLPEVSALAHRMEDLLDALMEGRLESNPERTQLMLTTTDALQALVYHDVAPGNIDDFVKDLRATYSELLGAPAVEASPPPRNSAPAAAESSAAPAAGGYQVRLPIERFEGLQHLVGELILNRGTLEQQLRALAAEIEECEAGIGRLDRISTWLEDEAGGETPLRAENKGVERSTAEPDFDELELDRYGELDVMSRHLVEVAADLHTVAGDLRGILRAFQTAVTRERGFSRQLENRLTQARLVSFSTLAPRLERVARVTAARQQKSVDFVVHGLEIEIDRLVLEELSGPLQHLIRNAVDHGIESPGERAAMGKQTAGRVGISIAHRGRQVEIEVSDDGRGLNLGAIRQAAARAGIDEPRKLGEMRDAEISQLIFVPGLSTAREVDEISGRGVGMDVVESTLHRLHGDIAVDSEPGRGVRFTLRLPLSLATDRVFLLQVGKRTYAVPQAYVEEAVSLPCDRVRRENGRLVLRHDRQDYPLVLLSDLLGLEDQGFLIDAGTTLTALILDRGEKRQAVAVDSLLGSREVVVKALSGHLRRVRGVVGATFLGGGELILIVNPAELAAVRKRPALRPSAAVRPKVPRRQEECVLIVDDSLSIRRAVTDSVTSAGWRAMTARDGQEALEVLQEAPQAPIALVLDVEMPRMDGFELTATLRSIDEYKNIPVIMLTSRANEKHRRHALRLGATEYLIKPFQEEVLLRTIREAVDSVRE